MVWKVCSEFSASVLRVAVGVGENLAAGDEILTLESMKMEIPVLAERAGIVADLLVKEGDSIEEGSILAHLA